jgi:hypothetical protein
MPREPERLQQTTMTSGRKMLWSAVFLLCVNAASLNAQAPVENPCFRVHVRLNGKPVVEPQTIIFKTKEMEKSVAAGAGCFKVPSAVFQEAAVDVLFTVPGNRVYLSTIPPGFFAGSWEVDLADRRFGRNVVLPKHARTRNACLVIFHVGEPEMTRTLTRCRTKF